MKQLYLLALALVISSSVLLAQAYESQVTYDKKKQQGLAIDYSYSAEAVENAFVKKLAAEGYKAKEEKGILNRDKGFLVYKNTYITDISSDRLDYLIKVERKSRKSEEGSVLYMVMLKGDQNALTAMDASDAGKAKTFLNNLQPLVEAADLELKIKAQEDLVAKSEKKLKDLKDDQLSLENKLRQNKADQEATQKEIEAQKQALGVLVGKRKTSN